MAAALKELRRYEYIVVFGAPHMHEVLVLQPSYDDYEMLRSEVGFVPSAPTNTYGLLSYNVPLIEMMNALGQLGFHVLSAVDDEEHGYIMERLSGNGNCKVCSCSCQREMLTEDKSHWVNWLMH